MDCQHGVPVKITPGINASTSTEHPATSPPDDIPVDSTLSGFDVVPSETSLRDPTPVDFLVQPWVMSLSHSHHFQLIFLPGHIVSAMIDHTCMTVCPSGFAINNDRITVMYTDKFGKPNTESVLCCHLAPYLPQKHNVNVVLLRGLKMGKVCHVKKAKRVEHIYDLMTLQQEQLKRVEMKNFCGVKVHALNDCHCSTFFPL